MSSQVITTMPHDEGSNKSDSGETDIEPGNQKNFYRHVSGAGEGLPLQTTADFGPQANNHIMKPEDIEGNNQDAEEPTLGEIIAQNVSPAPSLVASESKQKTNEMRIEPDWQKKIRSLQDQV